MLVSLLVLVVFLLLPTEFYSFVFGKSFGGIRLLMFTLAPGVWVFTYALIVGHYFSGIGKYSVNAFASGVGLVVCYFSSLFLIPQYTETGAGLAMSVSYISTSLLQKKELNVSINEFVAIKEFNPDSNVRAEKDKVLITASVERFTEGSVDVPIKVLNIPEGKQINTFPKFVKVTYRIALSNFNKIDSSTFLIECDYGISENNNLPYLLPKLVGSSSMIKNARISPQKIDFLINKRL